LDFIQKHFTQIQFAATFGGILVFMLVESFSARTSGQGQSVLRWLNNLGLAWLNFVIFLYFAYFLHVVGLAAWLTPVEPLYTRYALPTWLMVLLTLVFLELLSYWFHRAMHRVPFLWRIHAVHHNDTQLDVTTSHRHHPFEGMLYMLISLPLFLWLGVPLGVAYLYFALRLAVVLVSHADIRLPEQLDRKLSLLLVTPGFHYSHHLSEQRYTDSNYGTVVPWFDYLFGTASYLPQAKLNTQQVGLNYLRTSTDSRIDRLLALPLIFRKD